MWFIERTQRGSVDTQEVHRPSQPAKQPHQMLFIYFKEKNDSVSNFWEKNNPLFYSLKSHVFWIELQPRMIFITY